MSVHHAGYYPGQANSGMSHYSSSTAGQPVMCDNDHMFPQRARTFPLSQGLVSTPQFSPFSFSVHHDSMSLAASHSHQYGPYTHLGQAEHKRAVPVTQANTGEDKNVKVCLDNRDLWVKFHCLGTEMIITKTGSTATNPMCVTSTTAQQKLRNKK